MSNAKKKVLDLKSGRTKLKLTGNRTNEVKTCVLNLVEAFGEYIMNDNVDGETLFADKLRIKIEEHSDLNTAARYLDSAIRDAEEAVRREEEAARKRREALLASLKGGV